MRVKKVGSRMVSGTLPLATVLFSAQGMLRGGLGLCGRALGSAWSCGARIVWGAVGSTGGEWRETWEGHTFGIVCNSGYVSGAPPRRFQGQHHLVQSCLQGAEGMGSRLTILCVEHLAQAERWKRGSGKRDATAGFLGGCPSPSCSEIVSRQGPVPSSKQLLLPCPQPLWSLNSSCTRSPFLEDKG